MRATVGARNGIQGFGSWVAVRPADRIEGNLCERRQGTGSLDLVQNLVEEE